MYPDVIAGVADNRDDSRGAALPVGVGVAQMGQKPHQESGAPYATGKNRDSGRE